MIDTHAHIQDKAYSSDLEDVVSRARLSGVLKIFCIGSTIANSRDAVALANKYPGFVFPTVGIHPNDQEEGDLGDDQLMHQLELLLRENDSIIAIGECGLDFNTRDGQEMRRGVEEQKKLFTDQISLAKKYSLPMFFHVNKAYDEVLDILELDKYSLPGIFHFYTGGKKRIKRILDLGDFYFGVGGAVTYDQGIAEVVKELPLHRIVLETDCPYLAPLPHRGERNEPSWLNLVAEKIAELKNVHIDEVVEQTTKNAENIVF